MKKMRCSISLPLNEKGVTLLELLLSVVLLGILITGFFQVFVQSMNYSASNEKKLESIAIARNVSTIIKQTPYEELADSNGIFLNDSIQINEKLNIYERLNINESDYRINYEVTEENELLTFKITVANLQRKGPNSDATTFAYVVKDESNDE